MQQPLYLRDIGHDGSRAIDGVDQARCIIHATVRCHPAIAVIAHRCFMQLRSALTTRVFCRMRDSTQRRITSLRVPPRRRNPLLQRWTLTWKKLLRSALVTFQQTAIILNRRFIRNRVIATQLSKSAHQWGVVKRFSHRRVGQGNPLLQKMAASQSFQGVRLTTGLWGERRN